MKKILLSAVCCILSACVSADLRQYGTIDRTQQSITVPPGSGLTAEVKDVFKQNGWKLVVDHGPQTIEGSIGQNLRLEKFETFNTRYRLILASIEVDTCLGHFDSLYRYDMSMIDNKTGEEIMVMGGRACESQIVDRIQKFLNPTLS